MNVTLRRSNDPSVNYIRLPSVLGWDQTSRVRRARYVLTVQALRRHSAAPRVLSQWASFNKVSSIFRFKCVKTYGVQVGLHRWNSTKRKINELCTRSERLTAERVSTDSYNKCASADKSARAAQVHNYTSTLRWKQKCFQQHNKTIFNKFWCQFLQNKSHTSSCEPVPISGVFFSDDKSISFYGCGLWPWFLCIQLFHRSIK